MKRKSQKISGLYMFLLIAVIVYACVDDQINEPISTGQTEVQFSLDFSSSGRTENTLADVRYVQFSVSSEDGTAAYSKEQLEVLEFSGEFISEPFVLEVGDYQLTEFFLLDDEGNVLFATPKEGSDLANLVNDPLSIEFEASEDEVNKLTPEVVTTEGSSAADFGYAAFGFEVAEFFSLPITVMVYDPDVENYELVEAELNIEAEGDLIVEESLHAATNNVLIKEEEYENYMLTITKDGYDDWTYTYSADSLKSYEGGDPLVVVLVDDFDYEGTLYGIGWNSDSTALVFGTLSYDGTETIIGELDLGGDVPRGFTIPAFYCTGGYYYFSYLSESGVDKFVVIDLNGNTILNLDQANYTLRISHLAFSRSDNQFYGIGSKSDSTLYFGSLDLSGVEAIVKELDKSFYYTRRATQMDANGNSFGFDMYSVGKDTTTQISVFDNTGNVLSFIELSSFEALEYSTLDNVFYGIGFNKSEWRNTFGSLDLNGLPSLISNTIGDFWYINRHSEFDNTNNLYLSASEDIYTSDRYLSFIKTDGTVVRQIDQGTLMQWTLQLND